MFRNLLSSSRYLIIIAVLGTFVASLTSLIYGGVQTVALILKVLQPEVPEKGTKAVIVPLIELVDLFFIGTVFYIISMGLYELFIDDRLGLPSWLEIHSLEDLKSRLINGVVVILGVYFLGALESSAGQEDLLHISAAIALIIAALTLFIWVSSKKGDH